MGFAGQLADERLPLWRSEPGRPVGLSASMIRQITPRTQAGSPSKRNIHCQPARPRNPSSCRSPAEIGPPTSEESGVAAINERQHAGAVLGREPDRDVPDHARKKPSLEHAEEERIT